MFEPEKAKVMGAFSTSWSGVMFLMLPVNVPVSGWTEVLIFLIRKFGRG